MVQKEIRKKTQVYGTVGILSAVVLVALIYTFGAAPIIFNANASPFKTFSSYDELKNYLIANTTQGYSYYGGGPLDAKAFGATPVPVPAPTNAPSSGSEQSYSTTNIQVTGVDEADIVKNDGEYIYTVSTEYSYPETRNIVYIVKADSQDPKIVAKIELENYTYPAGIYLSTDSSRLVVIASQYQPVVMDGGIARPDVAVIYPYQSEVNTFIYVYDISNKASPQLARNFTISGSYFNSRMIGNYVYAVMSQPAYVIDDAVTLPKIYETTTLAAETSEVAPSSVYYADTIPSYFSFTTFVSLNVLDDAQQPTNMTIMMGGTSAMYVSLSNIYITYPTWGEQGQYTSIYRVSVNGNALAFEAEGSVPGYLLNQYSMDEYNGHFRVTTTRLEETTLNYIYVLDMNLTKVGELLLPKFEQRETIQSTRFIGDKCYVVTFEQKDPFFIVDMANPAEPKVAGQLKIPGYSSYLHPFDENHIIGLGMENSTVKLSLFDVTNVNAPTEIEKYIVEGDWTYSQALQDPKAFLFDKQKELLIIPISITQYGIITPGTVEPGGEGLKVPAEGYYWEGAYVFKLTLTDGFELRGGITQQENTTQPFPYYGMDYNLNINRALYIGNTLYTVSNARVQLNSLDNLALIATVDLN